MGMVFAATEGRPEFAVSGQSAQIMPRAHVFAGTEV